MTTRRSFMASLLAAGMAPAVARSGILMPLGKVWVPRSPVILYGEFGYIENFRFIESPALSKKQMRRVVDNLKAIAIPESFVFFVHPDNTDYYEQLKGIAHDTR